MIKANKHELALLNKRYNEIREDIIVGFDYLCEGCEITDFEVDDNGRTTICGFIQYLNNQYAIRTKRFERHPRLTPSEINYLLGGKL